MISSLVSIIITTKNEEAHIGFCLESIKKQTYKNVEIIVVDNNSTDKTKEIAQKYTSCVFTAGPERSAQRNFGAKKAKGGHLLFLDADMILSPSVIEECVSRDREITALVIPERSIGMGFWTQCKIVERMCYEGVDWMEAARWYEKEAFRNMKGFDEQLTGPEDFELHQRFLATFERKSMGRISSYIIHDEGRISLIQLLKKKYYYGKKMRAYKRRSSDEKYFRLQSNIFMRYGLFFRKSDLLIKQPVHFFGMILMKTLEMAALGLGGLKG